MHKNKRKRYNMHAHNFEHHTTWQNGARKQRRFPKRPKVTRLQYDINKFLKTAEEREDVPSTKNGVAESSENVQQREDSLFIMCGHRPSELAYLKPADPQSRSQSGPQDSPSTQLDRCTVCCKSSECI